MNGFDGMTNQELINYMLDCDPVKWGLNAAAEVFLVNNGIHDGITARYVKNSLVHLSAMHHLAAVGLATDEEYQKTADDLRERLERVVKLHSERGGK